MKKKKNEVIDIDSKSIFRSTHELWFYWYLLELKEQGYIKKFRREKTHPLFNSIKFKTLNSNSKEKEQSLLTPKVYTDDFGILWDKSAYDIFYQLIDKYPTNKNLPFIAMLNLVHYSDPISIIDVKNPSNKNNVKTIFSINQKWMFDKYQIYVQDIDVQSLFIQTFTPERFKLTDSKKSQRQINWKVRSLQEYVNLRKK